VDSTKKRSETPAGFFLLAWLLRLLLLLLKAVPLLAGLLLLLDILTAACSTMRLDLLALRGL
jgi:hypothetical protein